MIMRQKSVCNAHHSSLWALSLKWKWGESLSTCVLALVTFIVMSTFEGVSLHAG